MLALRRQDWDEATQAPKDVLQVPTTSEVRRIIAQHHQQHGSCEGLLLSLAGKGVFSSASIINGAPAMCVVLAMPQQVQAVMASAQSPVNGVATRPVVAFTDGTYGIVTAGLQVL